MIGPKILQVRLTCGWWTPVGPRRRRALSPWYPDKPGQHCALGEDMAQAHPYLLERKGDVVMGCPCVLQPPGMSVLLVGSWVRVEVMEP